MSDIIPPELLSSPWWRLNNLYYIKTKEGQNIQFKMNWAQRQLYHEMWYCNIILKARQLGISTYACILFLDACLFNPNRSAGIIAQTREDAKNLFKKIKHAYDFLPANIKDSVRATVDSAQELVFSNGSAIRVGTSLRGSTLQYLHISEFGKICADTPDKAEEIITGSLNTVSAGQYIFIESTAEGTSGHFYEMCKKAQAMKESNQELTKLDYKFHFFPWYGQPDYRIGSPVHFTQKDHDYFISLKSQGIELDNEQKYWYVLKSAIQKDKMKQEYPSCVAKGEQIYTKRGLFNVEDVIVDGKYILAKKFNGIKMTYNLTTSLGYSILVTEDHLIKSGDKFKRLDEIKIGDEVELSYEEFGEETQKVTYQVNKFTNGTIDITEDFARFLGYYMGDGSFYEGCLSIACNNQDQDVIEDVLQLCNQFIGDSQKRLTGNKKGCCEIRVSRKNIVESFDALNLLRQNSSGSFKRKVNVPWYIKRSPKSVVKNFLKGLFESDGHCNKNGSGVRFFSKHYDFIKDVSLLLLGFGITCRVVKNNKKNGSGFEYVGYEMSLRRLESLRFKSEIGFVSYRKNSRLNECKSSSHLNAKKLDFKDLVCEIVKVKEKEVFDLTTSTETFSVNGILVHNCPDEAWETSKDGYYYSTHLQQARLERRICHVPYEDTLKVHTAWDLGYNDDTTIWMFQVYGKEIRLIEYLEGNNRSLAEWINMLQKKSYGYGVHLAPHDIKVREYTTGYSRMDVARKLGFGFICVPRVEIIPGIDAVRSLFPKLWIDKEKCKLGIERLDNYRRDWNKSMGCWGSQPLHNDASHGADSLRVLATGLHIITGKRTPEEIERAYLESMRDSSGSLPGSMFYDGPQGRKSNF